MRRKIIAYGQYYKDFLATLTEKEIQKVKYVLSLLGTEDRLPIKFIKSIRDGLYELRIQSPNQKIPDRKTKCDFWCKIKACLIIV